MPLISSCPALCRASTSFFSTASKDVDGRDKPGHDELIEFAPSVAELLAQDTLFQAVAGIEQHSHRDGLVREDLDAADVAGFVMVGHRGDWALLALEHLDDDIGCVRE